MGQNIVIALGVIFLIVFLYRYAANQKIASYYKRLRFKMPNGYAVFSTRKYATLLNKKEPYNTNLDINVVCISPKSSIEVFLHGRFLAEGINFDFRLPDNAPGFPKSFNEHLERSERGTQYKMQSVSDTNAAAWKIKYCITDASYIRVYYKQFEGCWIFMLLMTDTEIFQPGIEEANNLVNSIHLT